MVWANVASCEFRRLEQVREGASTRRRSQSGCLREAGGSAGDAAAYPHLFFNRARCGLKFLRRFASAALVMLGLMSTQAWAFKGDVHLWIAQQVINDLEDDGMVSVKLNGSIVKIAVRQDIKDAILKNKNEFMLGNLGPDAMPDVVVGQTILHPGGKQWKANDWMKYIIRSSTNSEVAKAFAYGYLGHAAGDVFAHTYVNQYAGDHFDLSNEMLSEQRHVALESYMAKFTPPLLNNQGSSLGKGYQVVKTSDSLAAHIRDTLIYGSEAQAQYQQDISFAPHLVAFAKYRASLNTSFEQDAWRRLDSALGKFLTPVGLPIHGSGGTQTISSVTSMLTKVSQGQSVNQTSLNDMNNRVAQLDMRFAAAVKAAYNVMLAQESSFMSAQGKLDALLIEKTCEQASNVCTVPYPSVCFGALGPYPCIETFVDPLCMQAFSLTCRSVSTLNSLKNEAIAALSNERARLSQAMATLLNELNKAQAQQLRLLTALVDVTASTSPMSAAVSRWRADTDAVFADYVKASTQAIINSSDPSKSSIEPVQTWLSCAGPQLLGLTAGAPATPCQIRDGAKRVIDTIDKVTALPGDALGSELGIPGPSELTALKNRLVQDVFDKVRNELTRGLVALLPENIQGMLKVLDEDIGPDQLRAYFTKTEPGTTLLMIQDIATRVNREMNIGNGIFDQERFAALRNAVVLSKLALLDNQGLRTLAQYTGITIKSDGKAPFDGVENIIANAFVSLDGNHQWLDVAPPRPKSVVWSSPPSLTHLGYPFPSGYRSSAGFEPWHPSLREKLFRGLFGGPISPGIENPFEIGMGAILPGGAAYRYQPCVRNPFPNGLDEFMCSQLQPWVQPPPPVVQLPAPGQPSPPAPPPVPPSCGFDMVCYEP